jgi:hypothetical protein
MNKTKNIDVCGSPYSREEMLLNGWKEIANYVGRGVRTVQRWEIYGLPARRPGGHMRGAVIAVASELDEWLSTRALRSVTPCGLSIVSGSHSSQTEPLVFRGARMNDGNVQSPGVKRKVELRLTGHAPGAGQHERVKTSS